MKKILSTILLGIALFVSGCASLKLEPADFSWFAEEILDVDASGMVSARQFSVAFNVKTLLAKEFATDSMDAKNTKEVRLIRDKAGFYYIVAKKFKNVYVFASSDASLKLENTFVLSQTEMKDPKFNYNTKTKTYELWNDNDKYTLSKTGAVPIQGGVK
ncbi:MAG: hypothetical protein FD122_3787 [Stygiobacter sp.]|nr:MAG: hypothetical protein FD122_3787 [Stygiobacter sp.]